MLGKRHFDAGASMSRAGRRRSLCVGLMEPGRLRTGVSSCGHEPWRTWQGKKIASATGRFFFY